MLRALEKEGIEVVDGQQAMLDAREVKTADEIELLKMACSMVDATYVDIAKAIRPGTRENELVAIRARPAVSNGLGTRRVREFRLRSARSAAFTHLFGPPDPAG